MSVIITVKPAKETFEFKGQRGRKGKITVWPSSRRWRLGWMWFWEALGNGGEAKTREEAVQAAKRWISDRS